MMCLVYSINYNVFSMLSLGYILISDFLVINMFMHSLLGTYDKDKL